MGERNDSRKITNFASSTGWVRYLGKEGGVGEGVSPSRFRRGIKAVGSSYSRPRRSGAEHGNGVERRGAIK